MATEIDIREQENFDDGEVRIQFDSTEDRIVVMECSGAIYLKKDCIDPNENLIPVVSLENLDYLINALNYAREALIKMQGE